MTPATWSKLEAFFARFPNLQAGPASPDEVREAERAVGILLPEDFRHFIVRFGGAIAGSLPLYGVRRAEPMGEDEGSIVEMTRRFRDDGWPGTEAWAVVSMDNSGNPIGVDRAGVFWVSDHDQGGPQQIAGGFEEFLLRWCLPKP